MTLDSVMSNYEEKTWIMHKKDNPKKITRTFINTKFELDRFLRPVF